MPKTVTVKSKCCKDRPRCKRCPAVYKKLENGGHVVRTGKRTYEVVDIGKKALTAARAR